jgi:hypothetical protein
MGTGGIIGTGGVVGTGGITGTGGVAGSGAVTGTGGITISGGIIGTGGLVATGGIIGTGGAVGTGGVAGAGVVAGSGAVTGTGGITISGGTIGTIGTGGLVATGGIIGTGGAVGTGGGASTGGVTGTGGAGTWRCEGKTNLIENKQFTWYTNPTVSGSYTMSLYDTPLVGSSVGPSNPYKSDAGAIYADQIATGNLSTLAAGNYWGCVEAEVFSSSGQVSVEVKVVSAPPAAYGTTVITGPATLGVERKTICALGSITGALDGWQFAFQVWTTGANYGIYRAAICQVN